MILFRSVVWALLWGLWAPSLLAKPVHALTVYGEAPKYPAGFNHLDYVNPQAPKGGTFRRSSMEDGAFDHLVPYVDKGTGVAQIQGWLYSPLAYRSQDEPYTVYGLVAQSMELADDHSWIRFYLNPKARFADGAPVTAEDVIYTFNLLRREGSLVYRQRFADVDQVLRESPSQVRFTFKTTADRTLPLDIASLPVLPQHWWQSRNFANGGGFEAPLGNGPYRISAVDNGRSVTFKRVKDWWGNDLPINRGQYNFDTLRLEFFGDTDVARQILRAQGYDFNREFSATSYTVGYDGDALRDGRLQREHLAPKAVQGTQGFVFNLQKPQFQDRRVREALSLLWDFDWSNRQMMHGMYLRQRSFFSRSELAASQLPDSEERKLLEPWRGQIPDEVFDRVYEPPHTDASGRIRPQQTQALKLLEAAGWTPRGDQLVNAQGEPLQFTFLSSQKGFERLLLPYKRNLAQIGIGFHIRLIDAAQYANRVRARDYDMIVNGYPVSLSPGRELTNYFGSESADDPGSNNFMALRNPAVDALIDGLVRANDRPTMVRYAHALDRVLQWGFYWIPNYYPPGTSSVWWNRFGRPQTAPLNDVGIDTWWEISPSPLTTAQMRQHTGERQHAGL
ncbi:extracellular solute-binding protein [Pseudomonas poae]|uniref:ABC transporter substrate-binding protein n=1 Tax=Pseudomonas poae TaxID=200451 RepID=A0A2S9EP33_9PSED|nr:extracellular solute-binding protein [Pseudomonas poae]PRA26383.1 ABC transporter substrate-binding protein [Pseudomonas poae]PRC17303.1 ABC transporter substrate-binding protein [Pseudomonas poae]